MVLQLFMGLLGVLKHVGIYTNINIPRCWISAHNSKIATFYCIIPFILNTMTFFRQTTTSHVIVHRIAFQKEHLVVVRYQARRAIARSLPRAHPVLAAATRLGADVGVTVAQHFAVAALTLHVANLRPANGLIGAAH